METPTPPSPRIPRPYRLFGVIKLSIFKATLAALVSFVALWVVASVVGFYIAIAVAGFNWGYGALANYTSLLKGLF